jgi:hypothetical protein
MDSVAPDAAVTKEPAMLQIPAGALVLFGAA